jgi:hypothetical protein
MQAIESEMIESLKDLIATGDLESAAARNVYDKHKTWLSFTWPSYSPEAHRGLLKCMLPMNGSRNIIRIVRGQAQLRRYGTQMPGMHKNII